MRSHIAGIIPTITNLSQFFRGIRYLFSALHYRQLSVGIKMKNYKIKTRFVRVGPTKMVLIFLFFENCL